MARNLGNSSGDGSNRLVVASAPVTAAPLSIACWFRAANITQAHNLVVLNDAGNDHGYFGLTASGNTVGDPIIWYVEQSGAVLEDIISSGSFSASTWTHVLGVASAANSRALYVNGAADGTGTVSVTPAGIDRLSIGVWNGSGPFDGLNGDIAEVALWNAALTAAEAATLADGVSPLFVRPASLVCYVPLIGRYSPEIDLVGGLALTITGTAANAAHTRTIRPRKTRQVYVPSAAPATTVRPRSLLTLGAGC